MRDALRSAGQYDQSVGQGSPPVSEQPAPPPAGTGDPRIDAAIERLVALDQAPVSEHPQRYDEVHAALQDTLYSLDED